MTPRPRSRRTALKSLTLAAVLPAVLCLGSVRAAEPGAADAAAAYPTRPVKLVIPFPAGGATDYAARTIGTELAQLWKQPLVFDNRAGAGSTIGTELGANSPADGYTLVMGIPAGVTIAPHIYPKLGYAPLADLVPIAAFATSPLVVVVSTDSPFKTFADFVASAKASPGKLTYASNGSGSLPHLATEWFLSEAGLTLTHVPYRGSSQALPDLIAGRTDVMIDIIVSALPLIEGGKLRVLAVTGAAPTARLPGVPTVASLGYPKFEVEQWYGLFVPAGTPPAIVRKIEADVQSASSDPAIRAQLLQRGAEVRYLKSKPFDEMVRADSARWAGIAKATGARAE